MNILIKSFEEQTTFVIKMWEVIKESQTTCLLLQLNKLSSQTSTDDIVVIVIETYFIPK